MASLSAYRLYKLLTVFLIILSPSVTYSADPAAEYKKVQKRMTEQKKKLREEKKKEYTVMTDIREVSKKLGIIEKDLVSLRIKKKRIKSKISNVKSEIKETKKKITEQQEWLKRKLRLMNKFGKSGDVVVLLMSAENVSQVMRTWQYLKYIARHEYEILNEYQKNLKTLDEKNSELQTLSAELDISSKKIKSKEEELVEQKRVKQIILSSIRNKKAEHEKMIAELQDASRKLIELIKKSEKKAKYSAVGFSKLKGRLSWPVPGRIALPYGTQKDPVFNTPVFRNGIHIEAINNAETKAVFQGKVIYAEWFKGFGNLVIINHGSGYHTLYGNLSEIFSRVGDIIRSNQAIGKVGESGVLNAPGLYFEIRYKGKPLNPIQWLSRKKG
jgi:septal ring factor EnvC (AmiA/AmiB activator)